jgi:hypothetical protein
MGVNVMLGGLYFQVLTFVVFSILSLEFAWRVFTVPLSASNDTEELRKSRRWIGFMSCKHIFLFIS